MKKYSDFRILIAEDELGIRRVYEKAFAQDGYEVVMATSGGEVMAELAEGPFDLLITDLKLEHTSALDVLPYIRKNHPNLPIVVVSGHYAQLTNDFKARGYNVKYFFNKPLGLNVLRSAVREILGIPEEAVTAAKASFF
ncbi:MAG TPA: response regulator [bacterium]|nr:response regulator [bacterium]